MITFSGRLCSSIYVYKYKYKYYSIQYIDDIYIILCRITYIVRDKKRLLYR